MVVLYEQVTSQPWSCKFGVPPRISFSSPENRGMIILLRTVLCKWSFVVPNDGRRRKAFGGHLHPRNLWLSLLSTHSMLCHQYSPDLFKPKTRVCDRSGVKFSTVQSPEIRTARRATIDCHKLREANTGDGRIGTCLLLPITRPR
jgi:hypothetical protein